MRYPHATTPAEAVELAERIARSLARRNGIVSGYMNVHVGAGNPAYFWEIVYQHDGYDPGGWAKEGGALTVHGATLLEAVNQLADLLNAAPPAGS